MWVLKVSKSRKEARSHERKLFRPRNLPSQAGVIVSVESLSPGNPRGRTEGAGMSQEPDVIGWCVRLRDGRRDHI